MLEVNKLENEIKSSKKMKLCNFFDYLENMLGVDDEKPTLLYCE